jgi:hypothetical protein
MDSQDEHLDRHDDVVRLISDLSLISNAVNYSTPARAFAAENLIRLPLEALDHQHLAYVLADAYSHEALGMEDSLAWLFALREWDPSDGDKCLLACLDRTRVGVGKYSEENALALLDDMTVADYRELLRIPPKGDLFAIGLSEDLMEGIERALPRQLEGLRRVASLRHENLRGRVEGYNKIKHQLVAIPTEQRSALELFIPKWHSYDPETHFPNLKNAVWITVDVATVRLLIARAIIAQATLNTMLGLILLCYFRQPYETPAWVGKAMQIPIGWARDSQDDERA